MSTELLVDMGAGGLGGYLLGYGIKKVLKIVAVVFGGLFLFLQSLSYTDIISINYDKIGQMSTNLVNAALLNTSTAPMGVGFVAGFTLGLKSG